MGGIWRFFLHFANTFCSHWSLDKGNKGRGGERVESIPPHTRQTFKTQDHVGLRVNTPFHEKQNIIASSSEQFGWMWCCATIASVPKELMNSSRYWQQTSFNSINQPHALFFRKSDRILWLQALKNILLPLKAVPLYSVKLQLLRNKPLRFPVEISWNWLEVIGIQHIGIQILLNLATDTMFGQCKR